MNARTATATATATATQPSHGPNRAPAGRASLHPAHAPGLPTSARPLATPQRALRFLTAGSVDDGKSTLIGRLLYDSRAILSDQLAQLEHRAAGGELDLSLLTDGLEAEREQGITIDVAYRYFATPRRKFVIADAPGHEQYTRNMVTAAAGSDAAVVLVDITKLDCTRRPVQLLPQTRRHSLLAHKLRVPSIVFAINKMDAVPEDQAGPSFAAVRDALLGFAAQVGFTPAGIVPVSALRGDNITSTAPQGWYDGPALLSLLEALPDTQAADRDVAGGRSTGAADNPGSADPAGTGTLPKPGLDAAPLPRGFALPVQYVARHEGTAGQLANPERVYWGRLASGEVAAGDTVEVFPSGEQARVVGLRRAGTEVPVARSGESAGLILDRPVDISRGDWLVSVGSARPARRFRATLAWLDIDAAQTGRRLWVRHGHRWVQARIAAIEHRLDIHTLEPTDAHELAVNDIGKVTVELQQALPLQPFASHREGGSLIVVDPATHRTSGALMVDTLLD